MFQTFAESVLHYLHMRPTCVVMSIQELCSEKESGCRTLTRCQCKTGSLLQPCFGLLLPCTPELILGKSTLLNPLEAAVVHQEVISRDLSQAAKGYAHQPRRALLNDRERFEFCHYFGGCCRRLNFKQNEFQTNEK